MGLRCLRLLQTEVDIFARPEVEGIKSVRLDKMLWDFCKNHFEAPPKWSEAFILMY